MRGLSGPTRARAAGTRGGAAVLGLLLVLLPGMPAAAEPGVTAVTIQGGPTSASDQTPVELSADI